MGQIGRLNPNARARDGQPAVPFDDELSAGAVHFETGLPGSPEAVLLVGLVGLGRLEYNP